MLSKCKLYGIPSKGADVDVKFNLSVKSQKLQQLLFLLTESQISLKCYITRHSFWYNQQNNIKFYYRHQSFNDIKFNVQMLPYGIFSAICHL